MKSRRAPCARDAITEPSRLNLRLKAGHACPDGPGKPAATGLAYFSERK